jgi:hypothetical protein
MRSLSSGERYEESNKSSVEAKFWRKQEYQNRRVLKKGYRVYVQYSEYLNVRKKDDYEYD